MSEAAAHTVLGLGGQPRLWGWSQPAAHQHPPPQRRKFPLEPELESVREVRLGAAGGIRTRPLIQGIELGRLLPSNSNQRPEGALTQCGKAAVLTDGRCQAAQRCRGLQSWGGSSGQPLDAKARDPENPKS